MPIETQKLRLEITNTKSQMCIMATTDHIQQISYLP